MVLWTDGSVPFPFGKGSSGVLANCSLCGIEATLSFLAGQYAQVSLLKPAPFCTLFAGFGSTNKSATSLFLSDSRSVLTTISIPPFFVLPQSLWQKLSFLSSCSIRLQWVPRHSFLPGNNVADELAKRGALLAPSAIPCSLFRLISRIHSCLISDWRHTVSSKFFDTQVSSNFIKELVLPRHARCVLSRLCCNGHSLLLGSYLSLGLGESRILPAVPADTRPRTPLISFSTVQLRTLCVACFLATLCLFTTSGPRPGE